MDSQLRTEDFDYTLPAELIAQEPAPRRDQSRLMGICRQTGNISDDCFARLPEYFRNGDVLVLNRTRVIPARIMTTRPGGGSTELLLLQDLGDSRWTALARPSRKMHPGMPLRVDDRLSAVPEERLDEGRWRIRFVGDDVSRAAILAAGRLPLPPYIHRDNPGDRYQTVYADRDGSVAAPTAGLHFTDEVFAGLRERGVEIAFITLHVGIGTFKPIQVERVQDHVMHAEWGEITLEAADCINSARERGGRVIAVGTTTTRLLESAVRDGQIRTFCGETDRFIVPGYTFQAIDGLVTNFHLPKSTLLMLVSAFAGRELILRAYAQAVQRRYRFYSFGDAMLIL